MVGRRVAGMGWQASIGGCQGPSTAGVRVVGRQASGMSVVACHHRRRGTAGGGWVRRSPARRCSSVPGGHRLAACRAPRAGAARSRLPGPSLGWGGSPGASVASYPGLVAVPWASSGVSRGGALRQRAPPPSRRRLWRAAGPCSVWEAVPGGREVGAGGSRGRAAGVPRASADGARSGVALRGSPPGAGGGGTVPTVACLRARVFPRRRERGPSSPLSSTCRCVFRVCRGGVVRVLWGVP